MKKILGMCVLLFLVVSLAPLFKVHASYEYLGEAPEPELLSPISEVVDLTGQATLEFKWSPFVGELWRRQYWDFRLYKGRPMVEDNQLVVKKVDPKVYSVVLDAGMFKDGETYTWAVRQIYLDRKSDQAHQAFTVERK